MRRHRNVPWMCPRCGLYRAVPDDPNDPGVAQQARDAHLNSRACAVLREAQDRRARGLRPVDRFLRRVLNDAGIPFQDLPISTYKKLNPETKEWEEAEAYRLWVPERVRDALDWTSAKQNLTFPRALRLKVLRSAIDSPEEFAAMSAAFHLGGAVGLLGYVSGPRKRARRRSAHEVED